MPEEYCNKLNGLHPALPREHRLFFLEHPLTLAGRAAHSCIGERVPRDGDEKDGSTVATI